MTRWSPERLRDALRDSQRPVEAVALDVRRGVDSIRAYSCGRAVPPATVVAGLADALGVPVGELFQVGEQ